MTQLQEACGKKQQSLSINVFTDAHHSGMQGHELPADLGQSSDPVEPIKHPRRHPLPHDAAKDFFVAHSDEVVLDEHLGHLLCVFPVDADLVGRGHLQEVWTDLLKDRIRCLGIPDPSL